MKLFDTRMGAAMWLGCGVLALSATACSKDQPPARSSAQASAEARLSADARSNSDSSRDSGSTIRVSEELRRQCQLPNAPQEAPRFQTGDATLHPVGRSILDDVANCLTDGPLTGRTILLVGRADPRGSAENNQALSENRAEATRNYLVQRGLKREHVRTAARGEQGAQGTDEATWALDRRVDIELVSETLGAVSPSQQPSPILEGTRIQALSPGNNLAKESAGEGTPQSGAKPRVGSDK